MDYLIENLNLFLDVQALHAMVFVPLMNRLYSIGGAYTTGVWNKVFVYDLETEVWYTSCKLFLRNSAKLSDKE